MKVKEAIECCKESLMSDSSWSSEDNSAVRMWPVRPSSEDFIWEGL